MGSLDGRNASEPGLGLLEALSASSEAVPVVLHSLSLRKQTHPWVLSTCPRVRGQPPIQAVSLARPAPCRHGQQCWPSPAQGNWRCRRGPPLQVTTTPPFLHSTRLWAQAPGHPLRPRPSLVRSHADGRTASEAEPGPCADPVPRTPAFSAPELSLAPTDSQKYGTNRVNKGVIGPRQLCDQRDGVASIGILQIHFIQRASAPCPHSTLGR